MRLDILGAYGGNTDTNFLTSFCIDSFLAVDAGCLTQGLSLERQTKISDILLSHTHLDHILSLPFLVDNLFGMTSHPIRVWTHSAVINALQKHVFNEIIWPDFTQLPSPERPSLTFHEIQSEQSFELNHLRITPILVNHVVTCFGFLIECKLTQAALLFTADTGNTDRIWEIANACPNLKAVIIDCSFPNEMEDLAIASGHMTPLQVAQDLKKLHRDLQVMIYHIKPQFEEKITQQLQALSLPNLLTRIQNRTFTF
jgi:ribonuclease BN (tRNA processing enzyme)